MSQTAPARAFGSAHYQEINRARLDHLASLGLPLGGRRVVDLGAGVGDHLGFYRSRGCTVTAIEGRAENVALMRERWPDVAVHQVDLNAATAADVKATGGPWEVVHCYGLLYHLSRPGALLAFLRAACASLLVLETCVNPVDNGSLNEAREDARCPSQAIDGHGCRPGRPWVLAELKARFPHVFVTRTQPRHPQFPLEWPAAATGLVRSVFVASLQPLALPTLVSTLPASQRHH